MGYPVKLAQTARPLLFKLYLSSDHVSGATGKTPTVVLSKNGAAFAAPAGAVTELANGWYKVAGNATDSNALGPLVLYATAADCDPCDEVYEVVAFDPELTSLGLSLAKTTNVTGFNDIAATAVVSGGAITTSGGAVSTVAALTTNNDKTGYSLAAGGLDSITATAPTALATTFVGKVLQLWERFFGKVVKSDSAGTVVVMQGTGSTPQTTQTFTSAAGVDTVNKAT
jgi:hypothetical protein